MDKDTNRKTVKFSIDKFGEFEVYEETTAGDDFLIRDDMKKYLGLKRYYELTSELEQLNTTLYSKAKEAVVGSKPVDQILPDEEKAINNWIKENAAKEQEVLNCEELDFSKFYFMFELPRICVSFPSDFNINLIKIKSNDNLIWGLLAKTSQARNPIEDKKKDSENLPT